MTSTRTLAISAAYGRDLKKQRAAIAIVASSIMFSGCQSITPPPVTLQGEPYKFKSFAGRAVRTPHYRILTTVKDDAFLIRFGRVMEAAYAQYAILAAPIPADRPMEIDLFATIDEWRRFTLETTGTDAALYLRVNGGYAIGDRFVCWLDQEANLFSVAAHEGFHQYVARHFHDRLPPAIEEGIATTFETLSLTDHYVSFQLHQNNRRQLGVKRAIDANRLIPLATLIQMHAGDLIGSGPVQIEGFYGQCWALARLLLESPAYRPRFLQMLEHLRAGNTSINLGPGTRAGIYRPALIRPLLQAYVAPNWGNFAGHYDDFVRHLP